MPKAKSLFSLSAEAALRGRAAFPAVRLLAVLAALALAVALSGVLPVQGQVSGFSLDSNNALATGMWGDDDTIWVVNTGALNKIFAYNRPDGMRGSAKDFALDANNVTPTGLCSDGTTMFVVDFAGEKVYGYNLSARAYDSTKDITLHPDNDAPQGLWCDANTIWVLNDGTELNKVFAYHLTADSSATPAIAYGDRDSAKDFDTLQAADNTAPQGLWSDGETMFVGDNVDDKVYAYKMSDKSRNPSRDITLDSANGVAVGLWSDGDTLYVVDSTDDTVYAYGLPTVLVKNTGPVGTSQGFVAPITRYGQAFTTGTNDGGYALRSIGFKFATISDTATAGTDLEVTINEKTTAIIFGVQEEVPGNALCTLSDPASFSANAVNTFDAPTTGTLCPTLTKQTTYFIVIERVAVAGTSTISIDATEEDAEDDGALPGWSIDDDSIRGSSMAWAPDNFAYQIEVRGQTLGPPPVVTIDPVSLTIDEGGSDSYTVVLGTRPTADVTIDITAGGDVTTNPTSLTFADTNWDTPQPVTVTAGQDDDGVEDEVTITHAVATGSAAEYLILTSDDIGTVDVTVDDDDELGVTFDPTSLTVPEGGSATYTIVLDTEPSDTVQFDISVGGDLSVFPDFAQFTTSNWMMPQQITVTAPHDGDAINDSAQVGHAIDTIFSASEYVDAFFNNEPILPVTVEDDDVPPPDITTDASLPATAPFRVTITFHEDLAAPEEWELSGWYSGTSYSFFLTDIRQEDEDGREYSALVDKLLDGKLHIRYHSSGSSVSSGLSVEVDAPDPRPEPGGASVWSATMTVEDDVAEEKQNNAKTISGYLGYAGGSTIDDQGQMDAATFTWTGTEYTVLELVPHSGTGRRQPAFVRAAAQQWPGHDAAPGQQPLAFLRRLPEREADGGGRRLVPLGAGTAGLGGMETRWRWASRSGAACPP